MLKSCIGCLLSIVSLWPQEAEACGYTTFYDSDIDVTFRENGGGLKLEPPSFDADSFLSSMVSFRGGPPEPAGITDPLGRPKKIEIRRGAIFYDNKPIGRQQESRIYFGDQSQYEIRIGPRECLKHRIATVARKGRTIVEGRFPEEGCGGGRTRYISRVLTLYLVWRELLLRKIDEMAADQAGADVERLRSLSRDLRGELDGRRAPWEAALILSRFGAAGARTAVDAFENAANDARRLDALYCLRRIGKAAGFVIPRLWKERRHKNRFVRTQVLRTIVAVGGRSPETLDVLRSGMSDRQAVVRVAAVDSMKDMQLVAELEVALNDSDEDVRAHAVRALRELWPLSKDSVPAIKKRLRDPDKYVRCLAAGALQL